MASVRKDSDMADVVIIGAGISGMAVAIDMIRNGRGRNFVILEKGHRVGGTWSDNEYPGCACDVWSHLYSFSFCPNANWSREYPSQPEIQAYLADVARKYDLERHIQFHTAVESCSFDEASGKWTTKVRNVKTDEARELDSLFLVSAVGQLNRPMYPKISGLDTFSGPVIHSARWDKSVDLSGKRIGVIGNGATAIQIIPEIVKVAKEVVIFQRSPNWVVPRYDTTISDWRQFAYSYLPFARRKYRAALMDFRESFWKVLVDTDSPEHQAQISECLRQMNENLPGEDRAELRQKLTPNYPPGCKRILISDDYYPALAKDHTTLELAPIEEVTATGIRTSKGWNSRCGDHEPTDHEFDVIVCATGFQATQFLSPMQIEVAGRDSLAKRWSEGAHAYKGITVPGIPNFAMLYGPNTNLGHNSIILMIEAQSMYINRLITAVQNASATQSREGPLRISPRESVSKAWNDKLQAALGRSTVASEECSSWYKTPNGLITTTWSEDVVNYQKETSVLDWDDFELEGTGAAKLRAQGQLSWARVQEESSPWVLKIPSTSSLLLGVGTAAVAVAYITRGRSGLPLLR